jgi:hypothetical protein
MKQKIPRREFIGTGLVAALFAGCDRQERAKKPPLDERFTYDISKYEHTDPALLLYDEKTRFATGFNEPKCIAVSGDNILVGGDKALKTFDTTGKLLATRELPALPHAVTAGGRVAFKDRFEGSESFGDRAHLTAIAQTSDTIYVADAGNREVIRCSADGKVVSRFGKVGAKDGTPGFVVPSPYFDLSVGPEGVLWVVNPGKHRVEAYTLDGKYETGWGATAMNVEGFCGCCNPVYFTRLPDGRFVTSEKGLNRVKVYDVTGKFECVVAGPEQLIKDRELARKACRDCQVGFGMPVAADARGRVIVLDPSTRDVRIFERKEKRA